MPEVATPQASAPALAPLPPEIVGAWEVTANDPNGGPRLLRRYRFFPDATYDYVLAQCSSSTECTLVSSESGYAQAAGGVLSLAPQTDPSDGPRAYPYVVGRDPNVGDVQLHLGLADGTVDIFYSRHDRWPRRLDAPDTGAKAMTDQPIFDKINDLSNEEARLWERASAGGGLSTADQERLDTIKVELDQCYDLLHQREARRDAGLNPDEARFARRRSSSATSSSELDAQPGPTVGASRQHEDASGVSRGVTGQHIAPDGGRTAMNDQPEQIRLRLGRYDFDPRTDEPDVPDELRSKHAADEAGP